MKKLLTIILTLAAVSACGEVRKTTGDPADARPSGPDDGGPPGSDGPTTPTVTCSTDTHLCVPEIPSDWVGPIVYLETPANAAPDSCPSGYGEALSATYGGLDAGEAACKCECGEPSGITCGNATLRGYGNSSCLSDGGFGTAPASVGQCQNTIPDSTYYRFSAPTLSGGSCAPDDVESFDSPQWSTRVSACLLTDDLEACGDDVSCAPKPPEGYAVCIMARGDQSCPAGSEFSERIVRYASFDDTRTCGGCSCGAPQGTCGGLVRIKHNASAGTCSGGTTDTVLDEGECGYAPSGEQATYSANPVASCEQGTSQLSGDVQAADATTYCCMP